MGYVGFSTLCGLADLFSIGHPILINLNVDQLELGFPWIIIFWGNSHDL